MPFPFVLTIQRPPSSTLFPYTTLFRSEKLLLDLVRPHIAEMHLEQRRRRRAAGLTPRQVQLRKEEYTSVLQSPMAFVFRLSLGTVRTHMEHVFERLGVTSRTAAVSQLS